MIGTSTKSVQTVIIEALIVGICLVFLTKLVEVVIITSAKKIDMDMIKIIFLSGFLFHLVFEYTGINFWYAVNYPRTFDIRQQGTFDIRQQGKSS
jgi:hypothetical protein